MDSMHLIGAEDVRSAGNTISSAAREIASAASSFSHTMDRVSYLTEALHEHTAALARHSDIMERFLVIAEGPSKNYTMETPGGGKIDVEVSTGSKI